MLYILLSVASIRDANNSNDVWEICFDKDINPFWGIYISLG